MGTFVATHRITLAGKRSVRVQVLARTHRDTRTGIVYYTVMVDPEDVVASFEGMPYLTGVPETRLEKVEDAEPDQEPVL